VPIKYQGDHPPFTINLLNGTSLPKNYFIPSPLDPTTVPVIERVRLEFSNEGTIDWDVNLPVGSYVGFQIVDAMGEGAYSELKTVYAGDWESSLCE
jgi:hypothetical protein